MNKEVKFRFYDQCNDVMTYSDSFPTLAAFFAIYQAAIDGNNNPILIQYTELKDANGNEIYEGDVVTIDGGAWPVVAEVIFEYGCFCLAGFNESNPELKYYIDFEFVELIVIGNKYENPELLEQEEIE